MVVACPLLPSGRAADPVALPPPLSLFEDVFDGTASA
jgi:hypothetical protein